MNGYGQIESFTLSERLLSDAYWNFRYERKSLCREKDTLFFSSDEDVGDIGVRSVKNRKLKEIERECL